MTTKATAALATLAAGTLAAVAGGCAGKGPADAGAVRVFAAASLGPALEVIGDLHVARGHPRPRVDAASSSGLAKRIDAGAPADIFLFADPQWADWLEAQGRVEPGTRRDLLGNSLAIAAPAGALFPGPQATGRPLAACVDGRIAMGDPEHVPEGRYAKEALERAGWWDGVAARIVPAPDARAALAMVERGVCAAGILYTSDALGSPAVVIVERVPETWHARIVYPVGVVAGRRTAEVDAFLDTLRSPEARDAFAAFGFSTVP